RQKHKCKLRILQQQTVMLRATLRRIRKNLSRTRKFHQRWKTLRLNMMLKASISMEMNMLWWTYIITSIIL
ncbi:hypothetical protein C0995_005711, partial [Termitomyces sp. Mi166